jgi:predicted solute-binding protein
MAETTAPIAGGTTGSLADAAVAIDRISAVDYQYVKLKVSTAGSTTSTGVDASPLVVRERKFGTADYDSGQLAVPDSSTAVSTAVVYIDKILVTNITTSQRTYSLTNTAGDVLISEAPIAPHETRIFDLGGMSITGIKHLASVVTSLRAQIRGDQA